MSDAVKEVRGTFEDSRQYTIRRFGVNGTTQQKRENTHRPMSVEEAAEYTRLPLGTMYQKLAEGIIPGTKPGKRWVIYQDELDKWLDANRKNEVPMSADEFNAAVLASHRRKPKNVRV